MGSRTVWKLQTWNNQGIHLYAHSDGEEKLRITAEALIIAKPRWQDPDYFRRIFVSQVIGDRWDQELGYGLSSGDMDEELFEESYEECLIYPERMTIWFDDIFYSYEQFIAFAAEQTVIKIQNKILTQG